MVGEESGSRVGVEWEDEEEDEEEMGDEGEDEEEEREEREERRWGMWPPPQPPLPNPGTTLHANHLTPHLHAAPPQPCHHARTPCRCLRAKCPISLRFRDHAQLELLAPGYPRGRPGGSEPGGPHHPYFSTSWPPVTTFHTTHPPAPDSTTRL